MSLSTTVARLFRRIASPTAGEGAALVGMEGGGTVAQALKFLVYAGSGSDDTAALQARDAAAAAAGLGLVLSGSITVSSAVTFAARVVPGWGSRITTSGAGAGTKWLKFAAGCDAAPGQYWLNTDWPTQFLGIDRIYPQWFGSCGGLSEDSSVPMRRAFLACRASAASSTATPDKSYGCRTVHFLSGVYRCNNVDVYCGTVVTGEARGSLFNSLIQQIDRASPGLRIVPKNYGLNNSVLNNGVGQNFFGSIGLRSESIGDSVENEPICRFYSPSEATALLAISGDTSGTVGHVDTMFERVWFKDSAGSCIGAEDGQLGIHIRDSVFDVCRRAVRYSGTAYGIIRSYNNFYYVCVRGAFENVSTNGSNGVSLYSYDDEFAGCGNPANATTAYRRAVNWQPSTLVAGNKVSIKGATVRSTTVSGTRFGGPIVVGNVDALTLHADIKDSDATNDAKFVQIADGVKIVEIGGQMTTVSLNSSYANSRLIQFSQATQAITSARINVAFVNEHGSSSIATAIHSAYPISDIETSGSTYTGLFTESVAAINVAGKSISVKSIGSAATITLPTGSDVFLVTGTTNITSITSAGWAGKTVSLVFADVLTVTDGSNLKLNGNFTTSVDDVLTLTCIGSNWFERSRSTN